MTDEEEVRRSSIATFRRGSRRSNPGFSKSKDIDVASISKIRDGSKFKRVKKRANVQCTFIESVRFIILYLNLQTAVSSGEWPLLQSITNCMYFNVARIVILIFMCIG